MADPKHTRRDVLRRHTAVPKTFAAQSNEDTLRWTRAIRREAWRRSTDLPTPEDYVAGVLRAWSMWHYGDDPSHSIPLDDGWEGSIFKFWESGLPLDELLYAIRTAMRKPSVGAGDEWTHMCGIAWSSLCDVHDWVDGLFNGRDH